MSNYYNVPVVGIDVSADFSMVAILAPNGDIYRKPFKINHDASSFNYLLEQIKKVEEEFATKIALFMEATGIYHLTLFYFLQDNEVNSFVINPLVTNCTKNKNIRKVKNDKTDAISIAKLGKYENIKASSWLDTSVYTLRNLWLEYYDLVDSRANLKKKLSSDLRLTFPGYQDGFSDITGNTSLAILEAYSTPETIAKAPKDEVVNLLSTHSRKGILWAQKVYIKLMMATENARAIGVKYVAFSSKIQRYLNLLSANTTEIDTLLNQIKDILTSESLSEAFRQGVKLLTTLSGVGFITAVTIVCEIGDITRFKKSKQLTAFFGIDPSVNQSGKFNSTQNKMSKWGTRIGRRALYAVALASVRKTRTGIPINPVLLKYYQENLKGKKKKVALVAIMHKLIKYIFSILKNGQPYEVRDPKLHTKMYLENKNRLVIAA